MSDPRDHHFIPVFYLKKWALQDGKWQWLGHLRFHTGFNWDIIQSLKDGGDHIRLADFGNIGYQDLTITASAHSGGSDVFACVRMCPRRSWGPGFLP